MTLDECLQKYSNDQFLIRKSWFSEKNIIFSARYDISNGMQRYRDNRKFEIEYIKNYLIPYTKEYIKLEKTHEFPFLVNILSIDMHQMKEDYFGNDWQLCE